MQANNFQLQNASLKITYTASSIDGKPTLQHQKGGKTLNFRGDQIKIEETEIGQLISVTLEYNPDLSTIVFSLLLPTVNVQKNAPRSVISVKALETTIKTSIAGPALVKGPVQLYKMVSLKGTASAVVF